MEEATPSWDFQPRSVSFSFALKAILHPSAGSASISIPWLDAASGELTGTPALVVGPLGDCAIDTSVSSERFGLGAKAVCVQKELPSLSVSSLEMVQAIRKAVLPVEVCLAGAEGPVMSSARIHLGQLLLAGGDAPDEDDPEETQISPAGDEDIVGPEKPRSRRPTWTPPGLPQKVSAVLTDMIGVAGLHALEIEISTGIPILSKAMLRHLLPMSFTIDRVSNLINEPWLHKKCEDVYLEIYPRVTRPTAALAEELPSVRSVALPHSASIRFSETVVWFLGLSLFHLNNWSWLG